MLQRDALRAHFDQFLRSEPDELFRENTSEITVAKFLNSPEDGLVTYVSIGLSGHLLGQDSGRKIRQELLITSDINYEGIGQEDVIFSLCKLILEEHRAIKEGQVLGPYSKLFSQQHSIQLSSLLCSHPAYFDEEFCFFEAGDITVIVELLPLLIHEASFVRANGEDVFFEMIDEGDVDILDYVRK